MPFAFSAPLRLKPLYQSRVWGGRRLESIFGRDLPVDAIPCGESWEVSDRPEAQSVIDGGPLDGTTLHELWTHHRAEVFGADAARCASPRFPLLMKILDACDDLSLQVHPPADVAPALGGEPKTEMWFIAQADPGSRIYCGLRPGVTRAAFETALADGSVADLVHVIEPKAGDALFIPSGRLHAIGKGLVIFEIQQNSDTTYRVFDWNRPGLDGKPRPLHVAESLACIDFNDIAPSIEREAPDGTLVRCPEFHVRRSRGSGEAGIPGVGMTLAMVRGRAEIGGVELAAGDFALLPACLPESNRHIHQQQPESEWLEVRIPLPGSRV